MIADDATRRLQARIQQAFSETADPAAYVRREATETVLSRLELWAEGQGSGSTLAALIAPPGFGKTLLLRVIESRVNLRARRNATPSRGLYIPYAGLAPMDLSVWVHGLLGRSCTLSDAADETAAALSALLALGSAAEPFFLLMDDADSMPNETVRSFVEALPRARSPLRIVMALAPDSKSSRLLAACDPLQPVEVRLQTTMSEEETSTYLRARMRWAGLGEGDIDRVGSQAVSRIHTLAGGVPRRIHRIAASLFEVEESQVRSALAEKRKREDWMGRPIEDDL